MSEPRSSTPPEPRLDLPAEQGSPDLFGAWIVQQVGDPEPAAKEESWDTILLVGLDQLEILSQCITVGPFDYHRTAGGGIAVRQTPVTPRPRPSHVPAPVRCTRTLNPAERALGPLLLAAREVKARGDGSIALSGPAGTMIARRPQGALSNPRGHSPAPRVPPLLGAWRFVSVDTRTLPANERIELLLRPNRLEWRSGCVHEARQVTGTENSLIPGDIVPLGVCERMQSEAEVALSRLFANSVATRMSQTGQLRLQGSGVTAQLEPLTR